MIGTYQGARPRAPGDGGFYGDVSLAGLAVFAPVYGLDRIATVPPAGKLTPAPPAERRGRRSWAGSPPPTGWVSA